MHLKSQRLPRDHSPLLGTSRPPCPWSRTWLWRGWRRWARARCRWRSSPPWTSSSGSRILQTRKSEHTKLFIGPLPTQQTHNSIFNFNFSRHTFQTMFCSLVTSIKCYWQCHIPCHVILLCWVFYINILDIEWILNTISPFKNIISRFSWYLWFRDHLCGIC